MVDIVVSKESINPCYNNNNKNNKNKNKQILIVKVNK